MVFALAGDSTITRFFDIRSPRPAQKAAVRHPKPCPKDTRPSPIAQTAVGFNCCLRGAPRRLRWEHVRISEARRPAREL